jgi:hypothetical protein
VLLRLRPALRPVAAAAAAPIDTATPVSNKPVPMQACTAAGVTPCRAGP